MKLALNIKSAMALREFSESMPFAIQNIVDSTERLIQIYQSVAEQLGVHNQDFYNMLMLIKSAQKDAADAIEILPNMLIRTAEKIEIYVASQPTIPAK